MLGHGIMGGSVCSRIERRDALSGYVLDALLPDVLQSRTTPSGWHQIGGVFSRALKDSCLNSPILADTLKEVGFQYKGVKALRL